MKIEYSERVLVIPEWKLTYNSPVLKTECSVTYPSKTHLILAAERMKLPIGDLTEDDWKAIKSNSVK